MRESKYIFGNLIFNVKNFNIMRFIKVLRKSVLGLVFFTLFIFSFFIFFLFDLTHYENLKNLLQYALPFLTNQTLSFQEKELIIQSIKTLCRGQENIKINVSEEIDIGCEEVKNLTVENFDSFFVEAYLKSNYYKYYNCTTLFHCLRDRKYFYFLSYQFREELKRYLIISILLTCVVGFFYTLILESWKERIICFSTLFMSIGAIPVSLEVLAILIRNKTLLFLLKYIIHKLDFLTYFLSFGFLLLLVVIIFYGRHYILRKLKFLYSIIKNILCR